MVIRMESCLSTTFPFLSLPLEVRREVYLVMRKWPSRHHHAVLRVNRQIYAESKESFDQRALVCSSPLEFAEKVIEATPVVLKGIQTLAIYFDEDIYLNSTVSSQMTNSMTGLATTDDILRSDGDDYYIDDLQVLVSCLARLPNITELSILRNRKGSNTPPRGYLKSLLVWLSKNYTFVESLTLTVNHVTLDTISAFTNLQTLSCISYSLTPPADMISVVERLDHLEELTLKKRFESPALGIVHSFTGSVFRSTRPLKRLNLVEEEEIEDGNWGHHQGRRIEAYPPLSLGDLITALSEQHSDTMEHLTVEASGSFDAAVPPQLLRSFVTNATSLKTLTMDVVHCDTEFLEHLPQSLRSLNFTLSADAIPAFGEASLSELHSRLPRLQSVSYNVLNKKSGRSMVSFESEKYGRTRCVHTRTHRNTHTHTLSLSLSSSLPI
jgi:hypothetical protein